MLYGQYVTSHGKVDEMEPGDIIVYDYAGRVNRPDIDYGSMGSPTYASHHVAIYLCDGKMMESTTGPSVQIRDINDYEYFYSVRYTESVRWFNLILIF